MPAETHVERSPLDRQQVFELIRGCLADILEISPDTITEGASFGDDLGADSLALIELVEALEEELSERTVGFRIDDEDLEDLKTVRDAVDYVVAKLQARPDGRSASTCRHPTARTPTLPDEPEPDRLPGHGAGRPPGLDGRRRRPADPVARPPVVVRREPGTGSNERLEFLGDAVLGLVVTDHLYRTYPDMPEGELAKVRASVVNSAALAEVAAELDIGDALLLGKGEDQSGGRQKPSILADAMEALIGAVYLDQGWSGSERDGDAAARRADRVGRGRTRAARTTRPGCRSCAPARSTSCRSTSSATRVPTTPRSSTPWCTCRAGPRGRAGAAPRSRPSRPRPGPRGRRLIDDGAAGGRRPDGLDAGLAPMPELPEVETIRRDIDKEFVNKRIKKVEVTGARSVRRHDDSDGLRRPGRRPQAPRHPPAREVPAAEARQRRRRWSPTWA